MKNICDILKKEITMKKNDRIEVVIRKSTIHDAKQVVDVTCKSWRNTYTGILSETTLQEKESNISQMKQAWKDNVTDKETIAYVALVNDKLVGFIDAYLKSDDDKYSGFAEIGNIYILSEYQKLGIGGKLFKAIFSSLKEAGCKKVMLSVLKNNDNARKFYQREGGELKETRSFVWDGKKIEDEIYTFEL